MLESDTFDSNPSSTTWQTSKASSVNKVGTFLSTGESVGDGPLLDLIAEEEEEKKEV